MSVSSGWCFDGSYEGRRFWAGETPEGAIARPAGEAEDTSAWSSEAV